jgi:AI-2 transport protein TqsA
MSSSGYSLPKSTVMTLTAAAVVVILAGVKTAEPIVSPFIIAMFVSAISAPFMLWLIGHRVPTVVALGIVMTLILIIALILSGLVGTSLEGFSSNLDYYQSRLQEITGQLFGWLNTKGIAVDMAEARNMLNLSAAMGFVGSAFNRLIGTLANAFLIFLTVAFILVELTSFGRKIHQVAEDPANTMSNFGAFSDTLNRYLVIKSLLSLATGVIISIVLFLIGIDYPLLWGIIAFVLNFVPNIGSIIAAIPAVLLGLIQFGFPTAGWVALTYMVVNNVLGNIIEPRLMGRSLGLSTLVVFLSLVFWGWLLGPVGMFLSVPLTMTLKIAFASNDETRWLAVMLGGEDENLDDEVIVARNKPLLESELIDAASVEAGNVSAELRKGGAVSPSL